MQVRIEVEEPKNFRDIRNSKDPNADLDEIRRTIGTSGLKLRMYLAEIPEGRPELIEKENWQGVKWFWGGTVELPPQQSDPLIEQALAARGSVSELARVEGRAPVLRYIQPFRWPGRRTGVIEIRQSLDAMEAQFARAIRERVLWRLIVLALFVLTVSASPGGTSASRFRS